MLATALALVSGGVAAGDTGKSVSGEAQVIDANTLQVAGISFRLAGIRAPWPGTICMVAGRAIDCGHIARTALKDLVFKTPVRCTAVGRIGASYRVPARVPARCTAGGFDVARNMVHTGWALTAPDAPAEWKEVAARAREARHGLWRTVFVRGIPAQPPVASPAGEICVRVRKTGDGVECDAFRDQSGETYTAGRNSVPGAATGSDLCLCGVPARMSICMQGKTLSITRLKPPSECF